MEQQIPSQPDTNTAAAQPSTDNTKGIRKPKRLPPLNERVQEAFGVLSDLAKKGTGTTEAMQFGDHKEECDSTHNQQHTMVTPQTWLLSSPTCTHCNYTLMHLFCLLHTPTQKHGSQRSGFHRIFVNHCSHVPRLRSRLAPVVTRSKNTFSNIYSLFFLTTSSHSR